MKKGKELLKNTIPEFKLFLHSFLHTIENIIFKYGNDYLFKIVVTKQRDQEFIFKSIIRIADDDIKQIFINFDFRELRVIP